MLDDRLTQKLQKLASQACWSDDKNMCVDDYCGGNMDDAFWGGYDAGAACVARLVLGALSVPFAIEEG